MLKSQKRVKNLKDTGILRVSGSIESMSPKTDFTMKIPYLDYCDSNGVNYFPLGPTVWELPSGHENTVI